MKSKSFSKGIQSKVNAWRHHKNNNVNYLCMSGMYFRRLLEMFRKKQQIFYFFPKKRQHICNFLTEIRRKLFVLEKFYDPFKIWYLSISYSSTFLSWNKVEAFWGIKNALQPVTF